MKKIIIIFIVFLNSTLFSCDKERNELAKVDPKIIGNDSLWCVPISENNGNYELYKFIRKDNSFWGLYFLDAHHIYSTSEMYLFDKYENLGCYILKDRNAKERYMVVFNEKKEIIHVNGRLNISLDSIGYSENQGYSLFYTFPRIPYYKINPVFYFNYDTVSEADTIVPVLNSNCHIVLNIGKRIPLYSSPEFTYEYKYNDNKSKLKNFILGTPHKLDTIKKVNFPKKLDLFYTKEIDYSKYPFVRED